MYGLTRATTTLLAAAVAGFLVWLATQFDSTTDGEYWAIMGLIAAAGFVMAISQLLGGWTKWGWPRLEPAVLLLAFGPGLVLGFSFDTTGPRVAREVVAEEAPVERPLPVEDRTAADEPVAA